MSAIIEKRRALLDQMLHATREAAPTGSERYGPIPRRTPGEPVPLSFSQERLWFLDRLAPGSPFYTESSALRLPMPIDAQAMERAINAVVQRHEVLRMRIDVEDGRPLQVAEADVHVALPLTDLSAMPPSQQELELERIALENAMRPFDLGKAPLMRTRLVRLGPANHVFVLALHHIVTDGWSMNVFSREVSTLYQAFAAGRGVALPELRIQYFDYAAWQRGAAHARSLEGQLQSWREQLRDLPQIELPLDHPRPPMLAYRGSHLEVKIPPNLSAGLRVLSNREQATLFMSSLAIYAAMLHLHTAQTDIVVGTPVAGRNRPELEPLIGIFLNTLVLRLDLSGDPSYRELLRRVKATATAAYDRQDVPFDRLVEELQPHRDLGKNPLFQVLFQFFIPPDGKSGASATETAAVPIDRGTAILDLGYHFWDTPRGIHGRIEFSTELFEAATIERQFEHFLRLLTQVLTHPDRPLSQLDVVAPQERAQLLSAWQGAERSYRATDLSASFLDRVQKTPDSLAVIHGSSRFTYAQLDARANAIANALRSRNVGRGDRVAICLDRSPDMIASALAVFRCGAAYVPLDPSYPTQRLAYIVDDARAHVILTTRTLSERVASDTPRMFIDDALDAGSTPVAVALHPLDAAYVMYTSGSTGKPKGVIGLHGAAMNRFEWMWETFPFAPGEVACQRTAISFVDSIWETFGPLLAGVPLVVLDDETIRDTRALVRVLGEHRVTRFLTVPSLLQVLLETHHDIGNALPALRLWITSGERLSDDLLRRFRRAVPDATLVNLYGSSEVAGDVAWARFEPNSNERVSIGRPLANCRAYVLDATLRLVPPGIAGDLHIAGAHLARGYFGRPALTAERFLPDPFSSTPGARMYVTGDRVRHRSRSGDLEYLGRNDQQVKLRGYRIELGEIEAALREHPSVRDAAVIVHDDGVGGRLVAYVVTDAEGDALRTFVAQRLPPHMTPAVFVPLYAMPLTPTGKLDRLALQAIGVSANESFDFVAPSTEAEEVVAAIWSELLQTQQVGIHDNFFDLGGHSLLAIRLVSRIRADLGLELPLRNVFLHPTVAEQARLIEAALLDELDGLSDEEAREQLQEDGESHVV